MLICWLASILISRFLDKTIFHPGSAFCQFCIRFFNPGKRIGATSVIFTTLLWITWKVRNNWSTHLVSQGQSPIESYQIHTLALLLSAYVVYLLANAIAKNKLVPRILSGGILFIFTFLINLGGEVVLTRLKQRLQGRTE